MVDNEEPMKHELHSVLYVPGLSYNLLSVVMITHRRNKVNFYGSKCQVVDKKWEVMAIVVKKCGLYYLSFNQLPHVQIEVNIVKKSNEIVWHERFGYLGKRNLQRLPKESLVNGLDYHVSKYWIL